MPSKEFQDYLNKKVGSLYDDGVPEYLVEQLLTETWNAALKQAMKVPEMNAYTREHIRKLLAE